LAGWPFKLALKLKLIHLDNGKPGGAGGTGGAPPSQTTYMQRRDNLIYFQTQFHVFFSHARAFDLILCISLFTFLYPCWVYNDYMRV